MSRTFEARLAKVEQAIAPKQRSHEDWVAILATEPAPTEAQTVAMDAEIEAEAIAEHGSLAAAARAAYLKANRTRDPLDGFLAVDLESRAMAERSAAATTRSLPLH
ncbi:hypothetical protein FV226_22710 [Methylobacterium sp. WL12]|uniref:hypothetical protein n=1 Tax=Methylobacterium sp. WL12 TaxID=2603890 RepID=UPI0011CC4854|nr:hypothetical protein [Methylobacterium sp. WL12]TXM66985.1 hypothetical protein FV226_22710 [Methylobacterium sp. WL12]